MGYADMKSRLGYLGGSDRFDRITSGKRWTLSKAVNNGFSAHLILHGKTYRGFMNPTQLTEDIDTKTVIVDGDFHQGDVFKWEENGTLWIAYRRFVDETAFFKALCRRCDYFVSWVDKDRNLIKIPISIIGNSQEGLKTLNTSRRIPADLMTANVIALVPATKDAVEYFHQYGRIVLSGKTLIIDQIDDLSMVGVIQLYCHQTTTNLVDDDVENDVVNKWNVHAEVKTDNTMIDGQQPIKPLFPYKFITHKPGGKWRIDDPRKHPVQLEPLLNGVILTWQKATSGAFDLIYEVDDEKYVRHVIVDTLL